MTVLTASESARELEGRLIRRVRHFTAGELPPGFGTLASAEVTALELDDGTILFAGVSEFAPNRELWALGELFRMDTRRKQCQLVALSKTSEAVR